MTAWPLPALFAWFAAWALFLGLQAAGAAPLVAMGASLTAGLLGARSGSTRWRRWVIGAGFPASLGLALLATTMPAWGWLVAGAALLLLYPYRTWRDAPLFPTPAGALDGLSTVVTLPAGARVLDAGCGTGDGLIALRRAFAQARLEGVEWSWPLVAITTLRCRFAQVRRGDLWATDWSNLDLVYMFQRPESMPRAADKALRELRRGAWVVSLEFAVPGWRPLHVLASDGGRAVHVYRIPERGAP
jgi:SAM-dependent methyltransferase